MNVETLTNYLGELHDLQMNTRENSVKAHDIKTKVIDVLKELKLYDTSSITINYLEFENKFPSLPSPYRESLSRLTSHLESKIAVLKYRQATAEAKQKFNPSTEPKYTQTQFDELVKAAQTIKAALDEKQKENENLKSIISEQKVTINDNTNALTKKINLWRISSISFWTLVIGTFIAISVLLYDMGKDNATKMDDTEKASLRKTNMQYRDSVTMLISKIDSLKRINKKG